MIVEKIPITTIIGFFVSYIIIHVLIGLARSSTKKNITEKVGEEAFDKKEKLTQDAIHDLKNFGQDGLDLITGYKYLSLAFTWFPAIWVVIIIISLQF